MPLAKSKRKNSTMPLRFGGRNFEVTDKNLSLTLEDGIDRDHSRHLLAVEAYLRSVRKGNTSRTLNLPLMGITITEV